MSLPLSYSVSGGPAGIETPPPSRQTPNRPPTLLTTSLGNARNAGLGVGGLVQTPISSTTLSGPFSAYPQYPYPQSPATMRGTSPMASRSASAFTGQYNPQQWGAVNEASPNSISLAGEHRQISQSSRTAHLAPRPVGPDGKHAPYLAVVQLIRNNAEPVVSPPPPYSPRRDQQNHDSPPCTSEITSPADTTSPDVGSSHYGTQVSAATALSPDLVSRFPGGRSPLIRQHTSPNESPNAASAPSFPPPPGAAQRTRAGSKIHPDRLLSSLTLRGKGSKQSLSSHAIDAQQDYTVQMPGKAPSVYRHDGIIHPPAARRAASTGGIGLAGGSSRSASNSPSPVTWEPNMPLPPPPPGPPPASARSQSLNRPVSIPSSGLPPTLPFRFKLRPGTGTSLDTVPPTPADWRDEDGTDVGGLPRDRSHGPSPLHIDTGNIATSTRPRRDSSAGGLFRSPAVRNRSTMGIRERRSESRNGKGRAMEDCAVESANSVASWADDLEDVRPSNLVLSARQMSASKQRGTAKSATPKSGQSLQSLHGALTSPGVPDSSGKAVSFTSSYTTPQPGSSRSQHFSASSLYSPLNSPGRETVDRSTSTTASSLPAKRLSSPPPKPPGDPSKSLPLIVPPTPDQRPISHLLHSPNPGDSMQVPLMPLTKAASEPLDLLGPESPKLFAGRAIERHRIFAEREAAAGELYLSFV